MPRKSGENWHGERYCDQCGKFYIIYDPGSWAYKTVKSNGKGGTSTKYLCSWSCKRKYEEEHPTETRRRKNGY